jgi:two-component system sensor histidine kinase RegB
VNYFLLPFWEVHSEKAKLQWVLRLRWCAIVFLALLAVPGFLDHFLDAATLPIYLGAVALLMAFNLLTQGFWLGEEIQLGPVFLFVQMVLDLVVLSGLLLLSGGLSNPFYVLFYLNMSLGAVLLSGPRGYGFLLLGHLALALVQGMTLWNDAMPVTHLEVQHIVLFLSFFVSRSLGNVLLAQQEKLGQARIWAEKMDRLRALGALTAGFSHEFASPLNAVRLRLEREIKRNPSKDLDEALLAVGDCEAVLRSMNQSQLDPRAHRPQPFELDRVIGEVIASWRRDHGDPLCEQNLHARAEVEIPLVNFAQALMNFLDNAVEAALGGKIQVSSERRAEDFLIQVEDEGPGFSAEVLERFGEPFVTTKPTGTGLGLYSAQLYAQSLGGRVSIGNRAGGGASVRLHIPLSHERSNHVR